MLMTKAKEHLARVCDEVLRLTESAPPLDGFYVETQNGKYVIHAKEPWRRRPNRYGDSDGWAELTDVCTVAGGLAEDAKSVANSVAAACEYAPILASFLVKLLELQLPSAASKPSETPAAVDADAVIYAPQQTESTGDQPNSDELKRAYDLVTACRAAGSVRRVLEDICDALDRVIDSDPKNMDLNCVAISDRNAPAHLRLISGGSDARAWRADVLRAIADLVHPDSDKERLAKLPASSRVAPRGRPTLLDFLQALARCGIHDTRDEAAINREVDDICRTFAAKKARERACDPVATSADALVANTIAAIKEQS